MAISNTVKEQLNEIKSGCQGQYQAYCQTRCPMHTDVKTYVQQIATEQWEDSLKTIRNSLFLPATLGRICAHPCESACRRGKEYEESISIAGLKRIVAEECDREELWDIEKKSPSSYHVAVIGAGPAGAQAAIDLLKEGHEVTIYDKEEGVGGMLRMGIPNFRLPNSVIDFEYRYLDKLGVTWKLGTEIGKDIPFSQLQEEYDGIILANGANQGKMLPLKGGKVNHVLHGIEFLRETALTEESSLPCGKVCVIGGGDVAIDCARTALRLGATEVRLIVRKPMEGMRASDHEITAALEEGVLFHCSTTPQEVLSQDNVITALKVEQQGIIEEIPCDTLLFATGQLVEDITEGQIPFHESGLISVEKDTLATSQKGVFACGDNVGGTIAVEAMALGRKAAKSMTRYLQGIPLEQDRDFFTEEGYLSSLDIPLPPHENLPRKKGRTLPVAERLTGFVDYDLGFTKEDALAEGNRCFQCECKRCMKACIMLNDYTEYPAQLCASLLEKGEIPAEIPYSCNMCDQCTLVCPESYPFAKIFAQVRQDMVSENGGKPPLGGHKAIEVHQALGFSKLFTTVRKGDRIHGT